MPRSRYRVVPYKQGSKSAKKLAEALGGKVLKLEGSKYIAAPGDTIINWGNCEMGLPGTKNPIFHLRTASNKLKFFNAMREAGHAALIPPFWTVQSEIPDGAYPVVCRTTLAGHSGAGIVLANSAAELVSAPLYVKYIKKEQEYRVHVGKKQKATLIPSGQGITVEDEMVIIAVQRKARKTDVPDSEVNWKVRNLAGGFVYVREGFTAPGSVISAAKTALAASGLDFGAVDVIWNAQKERPYVLEINTAPGLEGQTVQDYAKFFSNNS